MNTKNNNTKGNINPDSIYAEINKYGETIFIDATEVEIPAGKKQQLEHMREHRNKTIITDTQEKYNYWHDVWKYINDLEEIRDEEFLLDVCPMPPFLKEKFPHPLQQKYFEQIVADKLNSIKFMQEYLLVPYGKRMPWYKFKAERAFYEQIRLQEEREREQKRRRDEEKRLWRKEKLESLKQAKLDIERGTYLNPTVDYLEYLINKRKKTKANQLSVNEFNEVFLRITGRRTKLMAIEASIRRAKKITIFFTVIISIAALLSVMIIVYPQQLIYVWSIVTAFFGYIFAKIGLAIGWVYAMLYKYVWPYVEPYYLIAERKLLEFEKVCYDYFCYYYDVWVKFRKVFVSIREK